LRATTRILENPIVNPRGYWGYTEKKRIFGGELSNPGAQLQAWAKEAAEQLQASTVWRCVCEHLKHTLAGIGPPKTLLLGVKSSANCGF
jgi:hypothetical protein